MEDLEATAIPLGDPGPGIKFNNLLKRFMKDPKTLEISKLNFNFPPK
jgi:succinyl-CoA synthetase alpha subunit